MRSRVTVRCLAWWTVIAVLVAGSAVGAAKNEPLNAQLEFGVKMAKRGLWSEALFRFRQANELQPGSSKVLNNIAVAYEALGQFEKALDFYQQAVKAGGSAELRKNYSRFVEFYRNFKPDGEAPAEGEAAADANNDAPSSGP